MANGKFDPGYSFRASETFHREPDKWQRPKGTVPVADDDDGKQACANLSWCHAATRSEDGAWYPARTFQPYCPACRSVIAGRLAELPEACVRLVVAMGERPRTGKAVRVPPGPREPIRLEVDALLRLMGWVMGSWHERVAQVDHLTAPEVGAVLVQHPERAVRDAVKILHPDRVDAVLALPPEPMVRVMYDPVAAEEWLALIDPGEHGSIRPSGEAWMAPRLSGVHAGKEILELHHRARRILGQVRAQPEAFEGVPCKECEAMALERAEPPSDPERQAMHSRCAACRHEMTKEDYDAWVALYGSWASSAGLACRRCKKGDHAGCAWGKCACAVAGHASAA